MFQKWSNYKKFGNNEWFDVWRQKMNKKTMKFISILRENSREKLTMISKKTNIPISTLFDILKELKGGIITKQTVLLDFNKLGYNTRAQVLIAVENGDQKMLKQHLICNTNINNIFKINSGWSFMVETVHKSVKDLDDFLENINQSFRITKQEIHYLIDEIKREGFEIN